MADMSEVFGVAQDVNASRTNEVTKWNDIYRAKCVDPKDPTKSGRVRAFIPELMHGTVSDNNGIWVYPASSGYCSNVENGQNGTDDCGSTFVPPKGSFFNVKFQNGDPDKGYVCSGEVLDKSVPTECQAGGQWWNKDVIVKRPSGRIIMLSDDPSDAGVIIRSADRSKGKRSVNSSPLRSNSMQIAIQESSAGNFIQINDGSGNSVKIDEDSTTMTLKINTGTSITMHPGGMDINVQGVLNIKATGNININGANINLNC